MQAMRWRLVFDGAAIAVVALVTLYTWAASDSPPPDELLAAWRGRDSLFLLLPAAILTGATCLAGASYFLAEDWLLAFVTGGYAVYGYLVVWGTAAALLADVALNRGRVSAVVARALWYWQP
jgi:hypothetical protein